MLSESRSAIVPGSQQQCETLVTELLLVALGGHGEGVDQAGIGGAPLLRHQPDLPRQQGLKLCRGGGAEGW